VAGATSALAAVLLLALGFAQLFQARGNVTFHPSSTATVVRGTPTPLPTAGPASPAVRVAAPNWQPGNFPTSGITFGERSDDILSFAVAATDGATAYACYSQTDQAGSRITMYRTSGRAMHWTQLTRFSLPNFQTSECMVQVDALDANRVLMSIRGQDFQTLASVQFHELTEDGGASWTKLSNDDDYYDIATVNGRTYALRQHVVGQQSNGLPKVEQRLSVSANHLRSWQPIDSGLIAQGESVTRFWARPDGELLIEAATGASPAQVFGITTPTTESTQGQAQDNSTPLWRTDDGGAHWSAFPLPNLSNGLHLGNGDTFFGSWAVQQPIASGQPWRLCANTVSDSGKAPTGVLCTLNGGKTWSVRPYLCASAPCGATDAPGFAGPETLTSDGSLLMLAPDKASHLGLYRLPQDSSQWQYLGPMTGDFFYISSARGGVLWQFAGGIYLGLFSGNIGGHLGSLPNVLLATAAYP
jgi:hypothetical protein